MDVAVASGRRGRRPRARRRPASERSSRSRRSRRASLGSRDASSLDVAELERRRSTRTSRAGLHRQRDRDRPRRTGRVDRPVRGIADLRRATPAARAAGEPRRRSPAAFRAARFYATHGLRARPGTSGRRAATSDRCLEGVAPERIRAELTRLLAAPRSRPPGGSRCGRGSSRPALRPAHAAGTLARRRCGPWRASSSGPWPPFSPERRRVLRLAAIADEPRTRPRRASALAPATAARRLRGREGRASARAAQTRPSRPTRPRDPGPGFTTPAPRRSTPSALLAATRPRANAPRPRLRRCPASARRTAPGHGRGPDRLAGIAPGPRRRTASARAPHRDPVGPRSEPPAGPRLVRGSSPKILRRWHFSSEERLSFGLKSFIFSS